MRRISVFLVLAFAVGLLALAGCSRTEDHPLAPATDEMALENPPDAEKGWRHGSRHRGSIVVANRGSGSISVLDARSGELEGTYALPYADGESMPEPMYVNGVSYLKRVFVGDRANDRVVVFDSRTFEVVGTVPAGNGVFHQWVGDRGRRLWVNNDVDNTVTVIDTRRLEVLGTLEIPADLVAMGGKPHDVVVDHRGRFAYVTVLGIDGPNDYLLQYDARDFTEINRQPVGKDPHLALGKHTDLYVPAQNSDEVRVFDPTTLELNDIIEAPGAHGAAISPNGKYFYATNLPGGGADALLTIKTRTNEMIGEAVSTPYAVPHNIALNATGRMLFVTHSGGMADQVTFYRVDRRSGVPEFAGEVTVGTNPFGLGYVY